MTNTPLARVQQMIAAAPHGASAARLLQNLVVFQGLFPRAAVIAMKPDTMTEMQRVDAFATLCQWRLVRKTSQRRYRMDESIKALFPPSRDVLIRYLTYWERQLTTSDDMLLYLYWDDIACALVWGLQHWPEKIAEISAQIPSRIWHLRQEWPQIIDLMTQFVTLESLSESFPPTSLQLSTERWQDQVLEFHINQGHPDAYQYRLTRYAEAASINQDLPLARQYYERAVMHEGTAWRHLAALHGFLDVLVLQKDIATVYSTLDQFIALTQGSVDSLHYIGRIMVRIDDKAAAKHYFANALQVNERGRQTPYRNSLLFRDWGRLENQDGNLQEATALYRLAIAQGMFNVERCIESYLLGDDITRTLARIDGAWRDFERLTQEWQAVEARHNRSVDKPSLHSP